MTSLAVLLAAAGAFCVVWGLRTHLAYAQLDARLQTVMARSGPRASARTPRAPLRARLAPLLAQVARLVGDVLPNRQVERIRTNLAAAGYVTGHGDAGQIVGVGRLASTESNS